jgi:hypothetical protein
MESCSRRTFVAGLAGSFGVLAQQGTAFAAGCVSSYVPARLTVDCASRQNFKIFRQYPTSLGLAGVVSRVVVTGKFGRYTAGNLFLFPWRKPNTPPVSAQILFPTSATRSSPADALARASVADAVFCGNILQAPLSAFIGFIVDNPFGVDRAQTERFTNLAALLDGKPVGINWTSSNLNAPYYAGSNMIPATALCDGGSWRKLIIDGLQQASQGAC